MNNPRQVYPLNIHLFQMIHRADLRRDEGICLQVQPDDDANATVTGVPVMWAGECLPQPAAGQQADALIAPLCCDKVGAPQSEAFALRCCRARIET